MKKAIKLIVLLLVLGGLVAGYFVYTSSTKGDSTENDGENDVNTVIEVLVLDSATVNSIEYVFDEETVKLKKVGDVWQWAEDPDFPLEQSYANDMAASLSNIVANRVIANTLENEADFGMDDPNFTIKYTVSDGTEYVYTMGNYNQAAEGYYIKSSAQDCILMTRTNPVSPFVYTVLEMAVVDSFSAPDAESITKVEYVVEGKSNIITKDSTDVIYSDPYTYFVFDENGVKRGADGKASGEFMSAVSSISLGDVLAFKPDEETLEKYGLGEVKSLCLFIDYEVAVGEDNTDTSVNVTAKKNCKINIGRYVNEEGKTEYFANVDGSLLLYELRGGEELFTALEADFESKLVCPVLADGIVSFTVEAGEKAKTYTASDLEEKEEASTLLNTITSIISKETVEGEKGELVLKAVFDMGGDTLELKVYKVDEQNCIATFCGEDRFVDMEKIQKIIELIV
ncbi:MAG: DUF4340 domain-containing protein [Clostridia bacterium]|nr:DUF4340 domain-containing protein [Clostridia bacterium]